jgi:hypothetical protein
MEVDDGDEVPIDQLPEEILLSILEYLNPSDLKSATLVASTWNKVISANASTMKLLPLHLSNACEEMVESTRNFVEIILENVSDEEAATRVIERHGHKVLYLQLKTVRIVKEKATMLMQLFKALPNLQKIFFELITIDEDGKWIEEINETVTLKHLKEIVATRTHSQVTL